MMRCKILKKGREDCNLFHGNAMPNLDIEIHVATERMFSLLTSISSSTSKDCST